MYTLNNAGADTHETPGIYDAARAKEHSYSDPRFIWRIDMKAFLVILLGITFFVSFDQAQEPLAAAQAHKNAPPSGEIVLASRLEQIAGAWYAFPVGTAVRFNDDGSADFGLNAAGEAIGYEARVWFEGQQLFIAFTNFDGESEVCGTKVGSYVVQLLEDGSITFRSIADACHFRSDILSGHSDLGSELRFHPVQ